MQTNKHPFDEATNLKWDNGVYHSGTTEAFANVIGPFGGVTAASLLKAALDHPERIGEPVALTVNFAAAIKDGSYEIRAIPMRTNRSTQHWNLELIQNDSIVTTGSAVFVKRRDTWSGTDAQFPNVPPPEEVPSMVRDDMPNWLNNYDLRVVKGSPDFDNPHDEKIKDSETVQWIQDKPGRTLDFLALTAMCDTFYPRVFVRRNDKVPASTIAFTVYFHEGEEGLKAIGDQPVLGCVRGLRHNRGYSDQMGEMWSRDGKLIATTSQMMFYSD